MSRSMWLAVVIALVSAVAPLSAQFVVIDHANLTQAIVIAERMLEQYDELQREFAVIQRMAQKLGQMDQYRIPPIALTAHDSSRWEYGKSWVDAFNGGDPRGTAYFANALPLQRPRPEDLNRLTPQARRSFESPYASVEITDAVAITGAHQVALVRNYASKLQEATERLEEDVLSTDARRHEMTAVLDKIAAGDLLGRRQDEAANQLLSHALEQLLARSKRLRDTETTQVNMQLSMWRDGPAANHALSTGVGEALRTWRQP